MESDAFEWQEMVCSFGIYGKKKKKNNHKLFMQKHSINSDANKMEWPKHR